MCPLPSLCFLLILLVLFLLSTVLPFHYQLHEFPLFDELSHFFSHFLPVYLRKLPQFGMGEGDQPVTLHLRYLFRLISSHPYSTSGLCTLPIIHYSTVCSAPFFRRLGCVVFLPFLRNQLLTNALSRRTQHHILRSPSQSHGCVVSVFLFLYSTYFLSCHQISIIHSFIF